MQPHQMQQPQMMMSQQPMQPQMMVPQQQPMPPQMHPQQPQQQQQPLVPALPQNLQQHPPTVAQQPSEEVSNHMFNPHQFNILRTQIHSYKLIIRNEPVPQKIIDVLKSKPPTPPGAAVPQQQQPVTAINGQPQVQQQQINAQQIRMRKNE